MSTIFNFFKKRYFLTLFIVFSLGAFAGYKTLESLGMQALINAIPIPEGSLADKDMFLETLPEGKALTQKKLVPVNNKAKNIILLIGDGMSISQISSYRLLKGGPNERLSVDNFPFLELY